MRGIPEPSPPSCWHRNVVPVESVVTADVLARLCLDCDAQLPATGLLVQEVRYDVVLS